MPLETIYDLYNLNIAKDQPFVDTIIAYVGAQALVQQAINSNNVTVVLAPLVGSLDLLQQNRILDRVMFELRRNGFRCHVGSIQNGLGDPQVFFNTSVGFNQGAPYDNLFVTWNVRNDTEFMKTYC